MHQNFTVFKVVQHSLRFLKRISVSGYKHGKSLLGLLKESCQAYAVVIAR